MSNTISQLHTAHKNKSDEFYTQYVDIENELSRYDISEFMGKVVLCNADNPYESNFFRWFVNNFNKLGLKMLICSCYNGSDANSLFDFDEDNKKEKAYRVIIKVVPDNFQMSDNDRSSDIDYLMLQEGNSISTLKSGDFRSQEVISLLKMSDIVVTNPPFSLFREFVAQLIEYKKKFLIIGNQNAITYKEIFPLFKENKIWLGYGFKRNMTHFISPYEDTASDLDHKEGMIRVSGVMWFTNMENTKRHQWYLLTKTYNPKDYPKYDNYNGIDVGKSQDIPKDYDGVMGVPITFMDKYNPRQFELVGFRKGDDGKDLSVNGKCPYFRVLIRNRNPEKRNG